MKNCIFIFQLIGLIAARSELRKNPQFKSLFQDEQFQHDWQEFKLDVLSYMGFDEYDDNIVDLEIVNYIVDRWFKSNKELDIFLKEYFKGLAVEGK